MRKLLLVILPVVLFAGWPLVVAAQPDGGVEAQVRRICKDLRLQLDQGKVVDDAKVATSIEAMGEGVRPVLVQMLLVHKPAGNVANARFRLVLMGVIAKAENAELAEYGLKLAAGYRQLPSLKRRITLRQPKLASLPSVSRGGGKAFRRFQNALKQQRNTIRQYNRDLESECKKASEENAPVVECYKLFCDLLTRGIADKTVEAWLKTFRDRIREDDLTALQMISRLGKVVANASRARLTDKAGAGALYDGLARIAENGAKVHRFYDYGRMVAHRRRRRVPNSRAGGRPVSEEGFSVLFIHRRDIVPAARMEPLLAALRVRGRGAIRLKSAAS